MYNILVMSKIHSSNEQYIPVMLMLYRNSDAWKVV